MCLKAFFNLAVLLFPLCLFAEQVIIQKDTNLTLRVSEVVRVAVGNSKILKVKALNSSQLLLTGTKVGKTLLRTWDIQEKETVFAVSVIPYESLSMNPATSRGQVARISLQFLEINEALSKSSGVQWPDNLSFSAAGALQSFSAEQGGINYSVSFSTASGFIQLLLKQGWAKIIANPDLFVRIGEEAVFHSGGEFPVSAGREPFGRFQRRVDWKKYGLTAKVRPESSDYIHFQTDIQLEISELDMSYQVDEIPSLIARNFTTKMDSLDGQTVILSGLTRKTSQVETQRVPLLGDLPLIGDLLFSRKSSGEKNTELLMAVTIGLTSPAQESDRIQELKRNNKSD